jgi:hypothetical protein
VASSRASSASSCSARASSSARAVRSQPASAASTCAFSFSSACARALSFQKPGSSDSRAISAARVRFRSTSKRPPERVDAVREVVEQLCGRCGHG